MAREGRNRKRKLNYQMQLGWRPVVAILCVSLIWGANWGIVKIGTRELAPLFMAGLRSLVASACLCVWMAARGIKIFPSRAVVFHGLIVGLVFGCEFGLVYVGLVHTLASRTYVLLYTAPFFVALGAHFFLKGDRLNPYKVTGLLLAFAGVVSLFIKRIGAFSLDTLIGDLMAFAGGALWGATTLYIKRFLAHRTVPLQTLFYQVFFSAPLLFLMSFLLEDTMIMGFSGMTAFSVFYQCIVVAFLSYLVWFELIHRYAVSVLHGFSFFTPVFGVILGGIIILHEVVTANLIMALVLVSFGTILVNRRPEKKGNTDMGEPDKGPG